jgi:desampylase
VVARLVLPPGLREELLVFARAGAPEEVCGILAGRTGRVERVFPVRNTADSVTAEHGVFRDRATGASSPGRRPVHYYMDPRDQLRVYNEIDALDLEVVGYYHSHTHSEARPSPTDIRLASDLSAVYVLLSLTETPPVRAWHILKADPSDETGELAELPLAET